MEDAMVLNKASVERGFAHGSVYRGRVSDVSRVNQLEQYCRQCLVASIINLLVNVP